MVVSLNCIVFECLFLFYRCALDGHEEESFSSSLRESNLEPTVEKRLSFSLGFFSVNSF